MPLRPICTCTHACTLEDKAAITYIALCYLNFRPSGLWAGLLILMLCIRVTMTTCFAAQGLLINNSVTHEKLGSVNGLAMSATALLRYF